MIELFPQLAQEKVQFTAYVDPQLVTFLREQYAQLKTAFKRFRASVKVSVSISLLRTCFTFAVTVCFPPRQTRPQILKLDSAEKVTKESLDEWSIVLVCDFPHLHSTHATALFFTLLLLLGGTDKAGTAA